MSTTKVITGKVRFSYVNIFKSRAFQAGQDAKYSVCLLIPKEDKATIKKIKAAIDAAVQDGIGSKWGGKKPANLKLPLRDGDAERADEAPEYADCFVDYEERTRTVTSVDGEGKEVEVEETYTVAIPVTNMNEVYARIEAAMGITVTPENQSNADSIYNIALYGTSTGTADWFPGADVPFISVDGFCSPVGANWESIVTSEFGYRRDPFTGETRGHSGMDLAVPTGTPIRAALPGTVTVSQYNAGGYGYYVMIDHGNGLSTLYGHNSRLLAQVGQTVEAGDVIALSGSTGRSTGPHLHFEVRVNGEQTDPRAYLPTAGG